MRTITLIFCTLSLLFAAPVFAQEEPKDEINTIFGKDRSNGGYGAFSTWYTQINSQDAIAFGARGAWIIDHGFSIGLAGKGYLTDNGFDNVFDDQVEIAGGYGGLLLEPIILPKWPIHISIPTIIGVGGVSKLTSPETGYWDSYAPDETAAYFVFEPGVEVELNMMRFFRLAFGASYRYTSQVHISELPSDFLNGWSVGVAMKFGKF